MHAPTASGAYQTVESAALAGISQLLASAAYEHAADAIHQLRSLLRIPAGGKDLCDWANRVSHEIPGLDESELISPGLLRLRGGAQRFAEAHPAPEQRISHPNAIHGTPITPVRELAKLKGASFCVSYAAPEQLQDIVPLLAADSTLLLDNGAFSAWRKGYSLDEAYWATYWDWAHQHLAAIPQAVAVIPDVIGGSPAENMAHIEAAVMSVPDYETRLMPIWHLDEPAENLQRIYAMGYRYIGFGSCGEFSTVGTPAWDSRVDAAFEALREAADAEGDLLPKVHMMRGLGRLAYGRHPFTTADSTNIARNHKRQALRGESVEDMRARIEADVFPEPAAQVYGGPRTPASRRHHPRGQLCLGLAV